METIDDVITKRFGKSLVFLMKVIDPERRYTIDQKLGEKWDALTLTEQRKTNPRSIPLRLPRR